MTTHTLERHDEVLFGLPVQPMTMDGVVALCDQGLAARRRTLIGVVNAAKIVAARKDTDLLASLLECDVLLADGQSVVWASRLLRRPLPERVAGIDLFERLLAVAAQEGRSVYLLGARPDVVTALADRIRQDYAGITIAGFRDGYFTDDESAAVADDIRRSGADMLFLGMTSPKKEIFLRDWGPTLGVPVLHGVGGSFDVLAGVTKRAPRRWQRWGLEWLYRLLQEPRRLWRRYLKTNTAFVLLTLLEIVRRTPRYRPLAAPAASNPDSSAAVPPVSASREDPMDEDADTAAPSVVDLRDVPASPVALASQTTGSAP